MGSSSKTTNQIPAYIEQGGMEAIERARKIADMGYVPYIGPDVAMPSPATMAAWQGQDQASAAFGMPFASATGLEGLPVANAGGIQGYSSFPGYAASLERLAAEYPGLYAYLSSMTIDPMTGAPGTNASGGGGGIGIPGGWGSPQAQAAMVARRRALGEGEDRTYSPRGGGDGGYTSIRDMYDGGGPGASGGRFEGGGLLSDIANVVTGRR